MLRSLARRDLLKAALATPFLASPTVIFADAEVNRVIDYLERHRRAENGYGWTPDEPPHITSTYAVVGCYQLLNKPVPEAKAVASFVRSHYPVAEIRRTERPLWRLDFEQVQTLVWLNEPVDSFRQAAATWTHPAEFTTRYELNGFPVFQHQAMAVCVRRLTGVDSPATDQVWRSYFESRRRKNGTFNHTVATDGSDGHVLNTLWGILALEHLGQKLEISAELADWLQACQMPSGGFGYTPHQAIGNVDDIAYTWAAVNLLARAGKKPREEAACVRWLLSLRQQDGGFEDRPGGVSNPLATYRSLDALRILGRQIELSGSPAVTKTREYALPAGSRVFTMQVEAPGAGSPSEAVLLADKLGIDIWSAKNAAPGWIHEAQRIAKQRNIPVLFAIGNEEYGTYVSLPGLGTYSHLMDLVAPVDRNIGKPMAKQNFAYPWPEFRETRIAELTRGGGPACLAI